LRELVVGLLQLPTLGMNTTRLEFYLKKAKDRGCRVLLFGEYVLNQFFKELVAMPKEMIREQTQKHIEILKNLSREYDIVLIAPIVEVKGDKYYKKIIKVSPKSTSYYMQQILINYAHWDEESFFSNPVKELNDPMTFTVDGFKIAVMGGFELHFDRMWESIMRKRIDIVLLPTASTFNSKYRWRELISMRAFLNNCYILRANRVGDYLDKETHWKFYGDSFFVTPDGNIEMVLEDRESMLIERVSKEELAQSRRGWGFKAQLQKRGEL
jgi:predicted amidohydrolase